jgi:hypothetical protein
MFKVMTANKFTAALPLNAHTYRLLIFKEPACFALNFASLRIVLFVSSRETRLCGTSNFSSTTLFIFLNKFANAFYRKNHHSHSENARPTSVQSRLFFVPVSQREANYSKHPFALARGLKNKSAFSFYFGSSTHIAPRCFILPA